MELRITATLIGAPTVSRTGNSSERWKVCLYPEGKVILENTKNPFFQAARKFIEDGYDPDLRLVLVAATSGMPRLHLRLGDAAKSTVAENVGAPRIIPFHPYPDREQGEIAP